jgi:hypothetical protein
VRQRTNPVRQRVTGQRIKGPRTSWELVLQTGERVSVEDIPEDQNLMRVTVSGPANAVSVDLTREEARIIAKLFMQGEPLSCLLD